MMSSNAVKKADGKAKQRIGVLFGGRSSEKEVSLATGRYVLNLLDPREFQGIPLYMDSRGKIWEIPPKLVIMNTIVDLEQQLTTSAKRVRYEELPERVDLVFNALLGKFGEDGCIQGILEMLKVNYTGSGILSSAVTMNKRAVKRILQSNGFYTAKDIIVTRSEAAESEQLSARVQNELGFPVIVKPVAEGSSVGVGYVKDASELAKALSAAFQWDEEVIIEEFISGQEFMCVVFGLDDRTAMLPSEVEFTGPIFTYESKYMPGKAVYHTPIRSTAENVERIRKLAADTYALFQISGYGRVDGFLLSDGRICVSELHTGTIMVPSSYVFQQASLQVIPGKAEFEAKGFKGKGGNFNPRTFISTVIGYAQISHASKKGSL